MLASRRELRGCLYFDGTCSLSLHRPRSFPFVEFGMQRLGMLEIPLLTTFHAAAEKHDDQAAILRQIGCCQLTYSWRFWALV